MGLLVLDPSLHKAWLAHLVYADRGIDAQNLEAMMAEALQQSLDPARLQIWVRGGSDFDLKSSRQYVAGIQNSREAVLRALEDRGLREQADVTFYNTPLHDPGCSRATDITLEAGRQLIITTHTRDCYDGKTFKRSKTEEVFVAGDDGRLVLQITETTQL